MVVLLLSGLWHGASWGFVAWGALHASYLVASSATVRLRGAVVARLGLARAPRLHRALRTAFTFALVTVAWVFFRGRSLGASLAVLGRMAALAPGGLDLPGATPALLATCLLGVLVVLGVDALSARSGSSPILRFPSAVRFAVYAAALLAIMDLGVEQEIPFIYFQF